VSVLAGKYSGLLRITLAGVIWGSIPVFVRMVDASPFVIVFWRVAFGVAAALAYLLITGRMQELARLSRRSVLALLGVGALLAVNWVLFFGALARTRVAVVELVSYTGPVFVAVLAPLAGNDRYDRRIVAPLVLALGGTALIVGLGELSLQGSKSLWGAAMAFGTAVIYAGLMLSGKRLLRSMSAPVLAFGQYGFATLLLLPAAILLPGPSSVREWGALASLGVVHTTVAIIIFLSGLRLVRADHAAVFSYAEPVTAVLFAAVFLAEPVSWVTVVGGIAVVAAGVLVARMAPTTRRESPGMSSPESSSPETVPQDGSQELKSPAADRSGEGDRSRP
jgi:drug/metabolite transporter (DMT)-like permease